MANTLPSLTILAQEALPALKIACLPFKAFSTDFSSDVAKEGSTVAIVLPLGGGAKTFSNTSGYVAGNASSIVTNVSMNIFHSTVGLSDAEVASLSLDRLKNYYMLPLINDVVGGCQSKAFSYITSGNYPSNFTHSALDYNNLLLSGDYTLSTNQVNGPIRASVLNPLSYANLEGNLKSLYHNELKFPFYRAALQGTIDGSSIGTDSNIIGFTCAPSALGMASRIINFNAVSPIEQVESITDSDTNFTLQFSMYRAPQLGQTYLSARALFGANVGNSGALVRIL